MKYKFKFNGIIEFEGDLIPESGESSELIKTMAVSSMTFHPEVKEPPIEAKEQYIREEPSDSTGLLAYFKPLDGLRINGKSIKSTKPVFSPNDEGKIFCGLFAHQNPDTPEDDNYYPGIKGSRDAKIVKVLSESEIEVDFEFNSQSSYGYIFHDNSDTLYTLLGQGGRLDLPEGTIVARDLITTRVFKNTYLIGHSKGTSLMLGREDYFPYAADRKKKFDTVLFDFGDRSVNFLAYNVNFLPPYRIIRSTQPHFPTLFSNSRKATQKLRVAVINCDTTLNQRYEECNSFGFGLGLIYDSDNLFYLKNFKHRGGSFTDFKVPDGGKLWLVMDKVELDFNPKENFQTTVFPCQLAFSKDKGTLPVHRSYPDFAAKNQSSSFYFFLNQYYSRGWNNFFNILHVDRFVFFLPTAQFYKNIFDPLFGGYGGWKISDLTTQTMDSHHVMTYEIPRRGNSYWVQKSNQDTVRSFVNWSEVHKSTVQNLNPPSNGIPIELQPGDEFTIAGELYKVVMKERGDYPIMPSGYQDWNPSEESQYIFCNCKLNKHLPDGDIFEITMVKSQAEYLLDGEFRPGYFIYKGNSQIALTETSKFGDNQVLHTAGLGHLSYNHKEIGLWAKDTKHKGFYRQSSGSGVSPGYTMINCEGFGNEFHPDAKVNSSGEMPKEATDYLDELTALGFKVR